MFWKALDLNFSKHQQKKSDFWRPRYDAKREPSSVSSRRVITAEIPHWVIQYRNQLESTDKVDPLNLVTQKRSEIETTLNRACIIFVYKSRSIRNRLVSIVNVIHIIYLTNQILLTPKLEHLQYCPLHNLINSVKMDDCNATVLHSLQCL